jgi:hypothetical protein
MVSHREVLEQLSAAIAMFGPDTRLKFHNTAFARLWGLDEVWHSTEPTNSEVLEALRDRRKIPEHADFLAFKRERLGLFTSLIEPLEEFLHLPDGRTLRLAITPTPRAAERRRPRPFPGQVLRRAPWRPGRDGIDARARHEGAVHPPHPYRATDLGRPGILTAYRAPAAAPLTCRPAGGRCWCFNAAHDRPCHPARDRLGPVPATGPTRDACIDH